MNDVPEYLDYYEEIDQNLEISSNISDKITVGTKQHINIVFKSKKDYPKRSEFRFVIPYGWTPIDVSKNGNTVISSTVKGTSKTGIFKIMVNFRVREELNTGDVIELLYNVSKEQITAGNIAYHDKVHFAFDVKEGRAKYFKRSWIKEVKMIADKTSFFHIKVASVYLNEPVDIEIVTLDKFGNRDFSYNKKITLDGDPCLDFHASVELKNGYGLVEKALSFKSDYEKETSLKKLLRENVNYFEFPVYSELKKNIGRLFIDDEGIKGSSNPIVRDKDFKTQLYWGDTHIHTREFSDGMGTADDAYMYAKNVVLHDFAAIADHTNQKMNTWMDGREFSLTPYDRQVWNKLVDYCYRYTDDSFVAIPAYEWSGRVEYAESLVGLECPYDAISDKVILFPLKNAEAAPLIDYISSEGCLQDQLYNQLRNTECVIISHTTISRPMGTSWAEVSKELEHVVEIYSMHGSSEEYGGGYRPLITNRKEGSVRYALEKGFKLGFIAGGDDHYTHPGCLVDQQKLINFAPTFRYRPGIAAIFSKELSSKGLLENLKLKNCYGTTGERMWIKIKINNSLMGEEIKVEEPPIIIITVCGTNKVEGVELIKNGKCVAVNAPKNDRIKFAYKDIDLKDGEEAYYYVRVTQFDGSRGWSSPIWVTANYK